MCSATELFPQPLVRWLIPLSDRCTKHASPSPRGLRHFMDLQALNKAINYPNCRQPSTVQQPWSLSAAASMQCLCKDCPNIKMSETSLQTLRTIPAWTIQHISVIFCNISAIIVRTITAISLQILSELCLQTLCKLSTISLQEPSETNFQSLCKLFTISLQNLCTISAKTV